MLADRRSHASSCLERGCLEPGCFEPGCLERNCLEPGPTRVERARRAIWLCAVWRVLASGALAAVLSGCGLIWTPPENYRAGENWEQGTPFGLLALLASQTGTSFRVAEPLPDFVKEKHLGALINLIQSDRPCAAVVLAGFSKEPEPESFSTIGNEAAYMIEGFRAGRYPPRQSSIDPRPDLDAIRAWWEQRQG